jgi:hypothetical protein
MVPYFGFWHDKQKVLVHDECRQYEVSFIGKKNIAPLLRKLSRVAKKINENCIYFKAGEDTCFITPIKKGRKK